MATQHTFDVAILGAGPAGMSAACSATALGLSTVVLDEQHSPGGQIYRAIETSPLTDRSILGKDYWHGASLVDNFARSGAIYEPRTTIWGLTPPQADSHWQIGVSRDGAASFVDARHVVLATGAQERPMPIPGWTLPGVLGAGAAQILLKSSGLVPSGRVVVAGSGPLLFLLITQLARAGARIARVLDTTPRGRLRTTLRHWGAFALSPYAAKGLRLALEACAKAKFERHVDAIEAAGSTHLEAVRYRTGGRERSVAADTLLLHQGIVPNINLAAAAGCTVQWDAQQASFRPRVDAFGASSIYGLSIAGDAAGIGGARMAEAQGRLAAFHAAYVLGRLNAAEFKQRTQEAKRELAHWSRGRAFVDAMYCPSGTFTIPDDRTIICRCEEVTAGAVRKAIRMGCQGPNQLKSFLRCGMGLCQGRFCGLTVNALFAHERNIVPEQVGYYRLRFPIKPLTLGELAALPQTLQSVQAVVRLPASYTVPAAS